jgi:hypothetical protein
MQIEGISGARLLSSIFHEFRLNFNLNELNCMLDVILFRYFFYNPRISVEMKIREEIGLEFSF